VRRRWATAQPGRWSGGGDGCVEAAPLSSRRRDIRKEACCWRCGLVAVGLLRHSAELYALPKGFYGQSSVFVLLR